MVDILRLKSEIFPNLQSWYKLPFLESSHPGEIFIAIHLTDKHRLRMYWQSWGKVWLTLLFLNQFISEI